MPGRINLVPGLASIFSQFPGYNIWEDKTNLWTLRFPNGNRGPKTDRLKRWTQAGGRWPSRSGFTNDPAIPTSLILSQDFGQSVGQFEPNSADGPGNSGIKFIQGRTKDASGNIIGGVTVQGFRTQNDQFVRETLSDSNGVYQLGTEYPGEAHYLVAYVPGAPDRGGTTVNTLIPTNIDGS